MTQNEMTPIREKIALRIKQLGITKKSVCEDLGLTLQNFSSFLTGKRCFPIDDLEMVLMYLGLTVKPKDYKPSPVVTEQPPVATGAIRNSQHALIRQKVKLRIGELNLPMNRVASAADLNANSLSSFLGGKRGLNIKHVEALFNVLDLALVDKEGFTFGGTAKADAVEGGGA